MKRRGGRVGILAQGVVCAIGFITIAGCGGKKSGESAGDATPKEPASPAEAAQVLDLSSFPLLEGAKAGWPRPVATLSYIAPAGVAAAFDFQKQKLTAQGWKELPGTSSTAEYASGTFGRNGFVLSVSVTPGKTGEVMVNLINHGNVRPAQLPVPTGAKATYTGDLSAIYMTDASVAETTAACQKLLSAEGWQPYGSAGPSTWFKKNGIRVNAMISEAPAQGGKTAINYSTEQLSADLPAPEGATDLRYTDETQQLRFETAAPAEAVIDFYRAALGKAGWQSTLDQPVEVDGQPTLIFRNPGKDMITLNLARHAGAGPRPVTLHFQSAAEVAELDRRIKEEAPRQIAAAAARKAAEAQELATAGWKEEVASLDQMMGMLSFSRESGSVTVHYTDTGLMEAEVDLTAIGAELDEG